MPHHAASDLETIFDVDLGEGSAATVLAPDGTTYGVNCIVSKEFMQRDEANGVAERATVLQFLTSSLQADPLERDTVVTIGEREYVIETLIEQDTYISTYSVS